MTPGTVPHYPEHHWTAELGLQDFNLHLILHLTVIEVKQLPTVTLSVCLCVYLSVCL